MVSAADHIHTISPTAPTTSTSIAASGFDITVDVGTPGASATQAAGAHTHSINISADGTYESRPRNIALKFFIKVSNPVMIQPVDISTSQSISGQKSFTEAIVVPELPQAIIFGDPLTIGTKALGIIGGQMVISMYTSAAVWSPIVWLS